MQSARHVCFTNRHRRDFLHTTFHRHAVRFWFWLRRICNDAAVGVGVGVACLWVRIKSIHHRIQRRQHYSHNFVGVCTAADARRTMVADTRLEPRRGRHDPRPFTRPGLERMT